MFRCLDKMNRKLISIIKHGRKLPYSFPSIPERYPGFCYFGHSSKCYGYEGDGKTIAIMLNREPDANLMINSYSNYGFRLNNGLFAIGPMAIFARTVLQWNIESFKEINENSLSLFYLLEPKIDVLVIGVGDSGNTVNIDTIQFLRSKGVGVEIQPTKHACATFNYLTLENRIIAGALIPPETITIIDDDIIKTKSRQKILYELDW